MVLEVLFYRRTLTGFLQVCTVVFTQGLAIGFWLRAKFKDYGFKVRF